MLAWQGVGKTAILERVIYDRDKVGTFGRVAKKAVRELKHLIKIISKRRFNLIYALLKILSLSLDFNRLGGRLHCQH